MIEIKDIDGVPVYSGEETTGELTDYELGNKNGYVDGFRTGFKYGADYAVRKISNELAQKVSDQLVEKILKAKEPD